MFITIIFVIAYLISCITYRGQQKSELFILKSLQTLKISKYRENIYLRIQRHEKRIKLFYCWPAIELYELYEDWQANRNRNTKS